MQDRLTYVMAKYPQNMIADGHFCSMIALATDEKTAFDIGLLEESFKDAFTKLVNGQPIRCAQTHVDFQTAGLPKAVILDVSWCSTS